MQSYLLKTFVLSELLVLEAAEIIFEILFMLVTKVQNRSFISSKKKQRLRIACNVTVSVKIGSFNNNVTG